MQVSNKSNSQKLIEKLQNKVRVLERKNNGQQAEYDKAKGIEERKNQQLKERLDTVTTMNHNMQRKLNISKKKADQYDAVLARCLKLENTNEELLRRVV